MKLFDVIGFGALNVDKLFRVNRIAIAEEESFITSCEEACGGSAANTMVGLSRLECRTGFVGKIAADREGDILINDFHKESVDTSGVIRVGRGRSGTVMGFVDEKGARALYVDPGVNDTIEFSEIDKEYLCHTNFLHLTSFVGEKPFEGQKKVVDALPKYVKLSLDPGEIYARKGLAFLEPLIRKTFVFMPNSGELALLTGIDEYSRAAEVMLRKGVKIVAVKLGHKGCYVTDGKNRHLVKAFKTRVVDTTGAGDAFCAGFLHGLISGETLHGCGKLGNFVASRCIMKIGARPGLPYLEDLRFLE